MLVNTYLEFIQGSYTCTLSLESAISLDQYEYGKRLSKSLVGIAEGQNQMSLVSACHHGDTQLNTKQ